MLAFRDFSIRIKIIILIVFVCSINNILISLTEYYNEKRLYNKSVIQKLKIVTEVIGESNTAAIIFKDEKDGSNYLSALKVDPYIENALILLPDSHLFVKYSKSNRPLSSQYQIPLNSHFVKFGKDVIVVSQPVIFEGEMIATIRIEYNLAEYKQMQKQFLSTTLLIIAVSIMLAVFLAYFFQKFITNPVYRLEKVMNEISNEKDYSIRSNIAGKDEIGKLSKGFNSMIAQIEKQNNDLKTAKAQSDEALKAKERFLANITHELRTPLSSILGLSTLLEETSLTQEQTEYLKNIKTSSDHLLSIINDLLEFSKLGSGKFQFEKNEFSLRKTIDRIERSMEFELKNRSLQFFAIIDEHIPHFLVGDEFRLNQILINLIGNAIKFTPKGHIKVSVNKKDENENSVTVEFRVEDTGIGISKDKQQVIFESFTQESSQTNRKYGGTGLGLTITKQLIELQNGEIRVESEKGRGSCFIFSIPFDKKEIAGQEASRNDLTAHALIKVMLIDDNSLNLMFTKSLLEKNNFIVSSFQNGSDALAKLENEMFDIILLDIHMPDIDGYEISKKIRSIEDKEKNKIPIVALTAAATDNEISKCFESGMDDYIVKPFRKEELIIKLLTLVLKKKKD